MLKKAFKKKILCIPTVSSYWLKWQIFPCFSFCNCIISSEGVKLGIQRALGFYLAVQARSIYFNMHKSKLSVITMSGRNCRKNQYSCWEFSIVLNDFMHLPHRHEEGSIKTHRRVSKLCLQREKKSLSKPHKLSVTSRLNLSLSGQEGNVCCKCRDLMGVGHSGNKVASSPDCGEDSVRSSQGSSWKTPGL